MAEVITNYPLCWPEGWRRTVGRINGRFLSYRERITAEQAARRLMNELRRMGAKENHIILSTNIRARLGGGADTNTTKDPGAAVYWRDKTGKQCCMAIDLYVRTADNIAALAATFEAMRSIERHGGAQILERVFLGFQRLRAPATDWRSVLRLAAGCDPSLSFAEQRYRELAKVLHPDQQNGDNDRMTELNEAIRQARQELR